jgi:hypothetical protein
MYLIPDSRGALIVTFAIIFGIVAMLSSGIRLQGDPGFFLYSGLLSAHGMPVDLHLFDIKPPGMHFFGVVVSVVISIGIFTLADAYVTLVTGRPVSGLVAAVALLSRILAVSCVGTLHERNRHTPAFSYLRRRPSPTFRLHGTFAALSTSVWQLTVRTFFLTLLLASVDGGGGLLEECVCRRRSVSCWDRNSALSG